MGLELIHPLRQIRRIGTKHLPVETHVNHGPLRSRNHRRSETENPGRRMAR